MVKSMKPGSVILDMAVEQGGNCAVSELGRTVTKYGVHIIGQPNLPATVATDSSALYARNVFDFLKLVFDKEGNFSVNKEDDIVVACLMCMNGEVLRKN
jgi:NAD(P) transhydrogenase subunit alpha